MSIDINGVKNISTIHDIVVGSSTIPQLFAESHLDMVNVIKEVSNGRTPILAWDGWSSQWEPSFILNDNSISQLPDGTVVIMGDSIIPYDKGLENALVSDPLSWIPKGIVLISCMTLIQQGSLKFADLLCDFLKIPSIQDTISRRQFIQLSLFGIGNLGALYTVPTLGSKFVNYLLDNHRINLIDLYQGLPPEFVDLRTLILNQKTLIMRDLISSIRPDISTMPIVVMGQSHYGATSIEKVTDVLSRGNLAVITEVDNYLNTLRSKGVNEVLISEIRNELLGFTVGVKGTSPNGEAFFTPINSVAPGINFNQSL